MSSSFYQWMSFLLSVIISVVRVQQQPLENPTRSQSPKQRNQKLEEEQSQKSDLTRFGQRAYVLGAIRERFTLGKMITMAS